jgi:hypothetical protein
MNITRFSIRTIVLTQLTLLGCSPAEQSYLDCQSLPTSEEVVQQNPRLLPLAQREFGPFPGPRWQLGVLAPARECGQRGGVNLKRAEPEGVGLAEHQVIGKHNRAGERGGARMGTPRKCLIVVTRGGPARDDSL